MELEELRKEKSPPSSTALAMHRGSQRISKPNKPKIRIIHIFAPEIIKTDVANFRELVQRLTGKPDTEVGRRSRCNNKVKPTARIKNNTPGTATTTSATRTDHSHQHHQELSSKEQRLLIKEEDDDGQAISLGSGSDDRIFLNFSPSSSSSGGGDGGGGGGGNFLGAFADLEHEFMQELGGDFPFCLDAASCSSTRVDLFGETLRFSSD